MIRLVALDVDGTILNTGDTWIRDETLSEIERIMDSGIPVCYASGRQFANLLTLSKHLADRFYYLAENGAAVFADGKEHMLISRTEIEREKAFQLADMIIASSDCEVVICGKNMFYLLPKDSSFINVMKAYPGSNLTVVESYDEIREPIVKISAYTPNALSFCRFLQENCSPDLRYAVSGPRWLDVTAADKGSAMKIFCGYLGVDLADVAFFGDNYNDIQILDIVGHPFIKDTAPQELRVKYSNFSEITSALKLI